MGFFHADGYERAVAALQAEQQEVLTRLKSAIETAQTDSEKQRIAGEITRTAETYQKKIRNLMNCLF